MRSFTNRLGENEVEAFMGIVVMKFGPDHKHDVCSMDRKYTIHKNIVDILRECGYRFILQEEENDTWKLSYIDGIGMETFITELKESDFQDGTAFSDRYSEVLANISMAFDIHSDTSSLQWGIDGSLI